MNRSYSKIRHIQEVNQRLENRLLNEQISKTNTNPSSTLPIKKTTSGCNGNNTILAPTIKLWGNPEKRYFELKMFFNATGGEADFQKGFTDLKNKIMGELKPINPEKTEIKFNSIVNVEGSASNYYKGALQPTKSNDGKKIDDFSAYTKFKGPTTNQYKVNLKFAETRWDNIKNYITTNGKSLGFFIPSEITNVKSSAYITDTGGCTDEERDSSQYPNPGQYAVIRGVYSTRPKKNDIIITKMRSCINKLKVVIGYFNKAVTVDDIEVNLNTKPHGCANATFDVYCNDAFLATVNFNNGNHTNVPKTAAMSIGAGNSSNEICSVVYTPPTAPGGTVYSELTLTPKGIETLINYGDGTKLNFSMKGRADANPRTCGGKTCMHGEAPMVLVYNKSDTGSRIIYHKEPLTSQGIVVETGISVPLGTFEACSTAAK